MIFKSWIVKRVPFKDLKAGDAFVVDEGTSLGMKISKCANDGYNSVSIESGALYTVPLDYRVVLVNAKVTFYGYQYEEIEEEE